MSLIDQVHPDWLTGAPRLAGQIAVMERFLDAERDAGAQVLPSSDRILRALATPPDGVRVLIVGQDPYPTPGHPVGLSFSVDPAVRPLPRSLANMYKELAADIGCSTPQHGDLSGWAGQGVMLLNRVLTVRAKASGSHARKGWEQVTDTVVQTLAGRGGPLVAVLWGGQAAKLAVRLPGVALVTGAHPSPLSAHKGFFGSRPFSTVNRLLAEQGAPGVDWALD